jgi:outer membrane protein
MVAKSANGPTIANQGSENSILIRGAQMQSSKYWRAKCAISITAAIVLFTQALIVVVPAAYGQEAVPKEEVSLSLTDAVDLALKNNLQSVIAKEQIAQAKGEKGISLSALLPNISGSAYQMSQTLNLASIGLPMSHFPGISPFNKIDHFDARFQMVQSVFNLSSILRYQAGSAGVTLASEQQRLAVQQVTTATAISYLAVLEAEQAVDAAQSNVQLAKTLLALANNQRQAGVANGIDVARAETRLANQRVQLSQAQTNLDTARLDLLRIVNGVGGKSLAGNITLRDQMRLTAEPDRDADSVVKQALIDRVEVSIAEKELKIAETQRKAAAADLLPSVNAFGDYGSSGLKPNYVDRPTRDVGVSLNVPIFNGGRTRSEMKIASSRQRESDAQLRDVRAAVEKDVRQALLNVKTREEQVHAAQEADSLATRELELAQDRFKNGVADNIEVVNAQTALENARLVVVSSLAQFNIARLNLASALGHVEDFRL